MKKIIKEIVLYRYEELAKKERETVRLHLFTKVDESIYSYISKYLFDKYLLINLKISCCISGTSVDHVHFGFYDEPCNLSEKLKSIFFRGVEDYEGCLMENIISIDTYLRKVDVQTTDLLEDSPIIKSVKNNVSLWYNETCKQLVEKCRKEMNIPSEKEIAAECLQKDYWFYENGTLYSE